jgi:hypothetical protein
MCTIMAALRSKVVLLLCLVAIATARMVPTSQQNLDKRYTERSDEGVIYNVFERRSASATTKLAYVNNSGICETTPGVNQVSGYLSVGALRSCPCC